jgi:hypothetical protein
MEVDGAQGRQPSESKKGGTKIVPPFFISLDPLPSREAAASRSPGMTRFAGQFD